MRFLLRAVVLAAGTAGGLAPDTGRAQAVEPGPAPETGQPADPGADGAPAAPAPPQPRLLLPQTEPGPGVRGPGCEHEGQGIGV